MIPQRMHLCRICNRQSLRYALRTTLVYIVTAMSAFSVSRASTFNFRIQDYKPDTVLSKQWELNAGWSALGVRDDKLRTLSYWDLPYEERGNTFARDSQFISLNSTWRNIQLSRDKEYTSSYSLKFEHENLKGVIDSTVCRNCISEGSLKTSVNDPKAYNNSISLSADRYFWKIVRRPVGVFASVGSTLLGEEDWGIGFSSSNSYSADSTYHRWIQREFRAKSRLSRYSGEVTVRAGITFGQQYEGKYASAVLYLLEELEKDGCLDHNPTSDDIRQLCDTALRYVNAYATDDRRHRVNLLTALTGTLEQMHLLRGAATQTTFIIDDLWYNMTYDRRPFGFQLRIAQQLSFKVDVSGSISNIWINDREVVTPLDSPYVTRVSENTFFSNNSNRSWDGTLGAVVSNSISAMYGLPLSSRWQWNTLLTAVSGNITHDWNYYTVHNVIDKWWDNASASLTSHLEYHATPRTIYVASLSAEAKRQRTPSSYYPDEIVDFLGRSRFIRSQISCRHWVVEEVALNTQLYFNANHQSSTSPYSKASNWSREYGIAIGVSVRGGY
jgi:hypothetical protein